MDSQLTLIGGDTELAAPDPSFGAATILDFERDVMISTSATVRGQSHTRYSVRTVRAGLVGMNPKTIISEGERVLATVLRRDMVPDLLTLGGSSMSLGSWLKTPMFSSFPASFKEGGETYIWKESLDDGIYLYRESNTTVIARFYPSYFEVTQDRRRITYRAHLDLRPEADFIRDRVFISCVLIVQKTRKNAGAKERDLVSASQGLMFSSMAAPGTGF
ncbi:hypothetical protein K503DRAFT_776448 [Rhizopogon vinicolor AM-OR11-026]|uniref:DUF6593 domain-containing protein n=1 Tax=Rhizopogon vinicolor AM-OR11-026 TaxID=1314800 RepID=A0A1B7MJ72_9AGAM|nr:hypothetical protein K503DRAFT_776448 [Rhizopogon vinicolor AM-OR11-026]